MKKVLFWTIIVIVFCIVGCKIIDPVPEEAETKGNISGRVTADNGIAVADAAIELVGYGQNRTTGTTGQYAFYDLESGSYQLKISKKNYDEKTVDVVVNGGSTTTKNITLISSYGTISGTVTDAITKEKLSGVKVSISGKTTITTDANGYYEFTNLSSGSFTISFSLDGYQDDDLTVKVTAGSITQGNIQLKKSSIAVNLTALNFGLSEIQKSFILTGEANENKSYTISCDANWINISNEDKTGNVSKTNPKTIMINVDRSYLSGGNNSTTISILSDGIVLHKIAVTISKGYIKLITPNGNDNLVLKNSTTISWETNLSTSTTIALYKAGTFIENIQSNISDKSITWSIKSTYSAGSDYKIRVTNGSVYDESDANFTLSELPILGLSEESLDFGYDKTSKSLTLTNTGTGSLNWQLTAEFDWLSINGDISGSLTAGESKTIELIANRVGKASGYSDSKNLQIAYNGNTKNIPVSMSVTAESPKAKLSITPTSYNFGEVIVGNESSEQIFTLTNTGNVAISAVNVALENTENFSISEGSGTQSLPIGASHIIKVKFKPQTATTTNKTTNLLASTSEADNVQAVLSGTAKELISVKLSYPLSGATSVEPSLDVVWTSDDATSFDVYLDKNNPPQTKLNSNELNTKNFNVSGLDFGTKYYWKVIGKKEGFPDTTSEVWSFTTKEPLAINLSSPSDNDLNTETSFNLEWISNGTSFDIYLDANNPPTTKINTANVTEKSFSVKNLNYSKKYYWKVVAKKDGYSDIHSSIRNFTTKEALAVTLNSPTTGLTNQEISLSLAWTSNGTSFDIYLDENNPPTTKINTSDITAKTYTVSGLSYEKTYYWRVVAKRNSYSDLPSEVRNFTTMEEAAKRIKWIYRPSSNENFIGMPAIGSDGTIYAGCDDYKLYAINPDGTLKWTFQTGDCVYTPTIGSDGTIYVKSNDQYLYAINSDGTQKWKFLSNNCKYVTIANDGNLVIEHDGKVTMLYASNGSIKWQKDHVSAEGIKSEGFSIGKDGIIYYTTSNHLVAVNPSDGNMIWSFTDDDLRFDQVSPAIASDGTIIVGAEENDDGLYAINSDGTKNWDRSIGGECRTHPIISSYGNIYAASAIQFHAKNANGSSRWVCTTSGSDWFNDRLSASIGYDGTIYVLTTAYLRAFNISGQLLWKLSGAVDESSPVLVSDGTMYISDFYKGLMAIDTRVSGGYQPGSPWPKYRGNNRNTGNINDN